MIEHDQLQNTQKILKTYRYHNKKHMKQYYVTCSKQKNDKKRNNKNTILYNPE